MQTLAFDNAVFISDLHLTEDRPACNRAFYSFLDWLPETTDALFILGDFFEYWVGDDLTTELSHTVAQRLAQLVATKDIALFFVPGNRDFAIGSHYCQCAGMSLLSDNSHFRIAGRSVVVCHGDLLCTDDKAYQRFRKLIRQPLIMSSLLKLPTWLRIRIAERLRQNSKKRFQRNPVYVDVTAQAVETLFQQTQAELIVHGHTHMADIHLHSVSADQNHKRMVLGDWHQVGWYGVIDEHGEQLHQFDIHTPDFAATGQPQTMNS